MNRINSLFHENLDNSKSIGIWISDKKSQKLNWEELKNACYLRGFNLIKLNLDNPIETQGKLDVFLHKLTDIIAAADQGDVKASSIIGRVQQYLSNHPNIIIIDSLENVRILLNRYCYYSIIQDETSFKNLGIYTPPFAEFTTCNSEQNFEIMKQCGVNFPVICKPTIAHGSKLAHEMVLIFNKRGLSVCKPPCVVQSFVNHNAVLHKIFLVGNRYHICQRPSLKNFYSCDDLDPIYYSTGEVCKADSQSTLSILDPHDKADRDYMSVDEDKIKHIIHVLRKRIGLTLAGFDVVIDNATGNHAVIDINVFPSYDNFPNFFEHLLDCIEDMIVKIPNDCNLDQCVETDKLFRKQKSNGLINVGGGPMTYGVKGMNIN